MCKACFLIHLIAVFISRCDVGHRRPSQHLTKMQSEDNSNSDEQPGNFIIIILPHNVR